MTIAIPTKQPAPARFVPPNGGETLTLGPDTLRFVLDAADTGGTLSLIERTVAGNFQSPPAPHTNTREDWFYYVLEGRLGFRFDSGDVIADARGTVWVPRGAYFRWWNPDPTPARCLCLYTPGAFGQFFKDVVAAVTPKSDVLGDYTRTLPDLLAIADTYGIVRRAVESAPTHAR
ncbi:MAG: cupin domain-containing protein [Alphaproteobacteria bacterium]